MGAAQQNLVIEKGQSFTPSLLWQVPGISIPVTGTTGFLSTSITVTSATNLAIGQSLTGPGLQANTIITAISGVTLTINLPATAAGTNVALVAGALVGINLTGATLLFTAKLSKTDLDTASTTVSVNWQETSTPNLGLTTLPLTDTITAGMGNFTTSPLQNSYYYQIWGLNIGGYPVLFPLQEGILTITQSVSQRTA